MTISAQSLRVIDIKTGAEVTEFQSSHLGKTFNFIFTFAETIFTGSVGVLPSGNFLTYFINAGVSPVSAAGATELKIQGQLRGDITEDIKSITLGVSQGYENGSGEAVSFSAIPVTDQFGNTVVASLGTVPEITTGSGATAAISVNEHVTAVTDVDTTDDGSTDPSTITYSISGDDASLFSINASTGALSFLSAPDYESPQDANADGVYEVTVTVTDIIGQADSQAISVTVNDINDSPTGSVTISGTASQGQILTASNTLADEDGLGVIGYQWQRGGVNISGATASTYTLTQDDVGAAIAVVASYTDGIGTAESMASTATSAVTNVNDAPVNTVPGAQTIEADTSLTFSAANGNLLSIADIDAGTSSVTSTLTVASGKISVTGGGGAVLANNSSASVTITGTVAEINLALATVTYTPATGYTGTETLTLVTDDGDSTSVGGAQTDTDTVTISIRDIPDSTGTGISGTTTPLDPRGPLDPVVSGFSITVGEASNVSGTQTVGNGTNGTLLASYLADVQAANSGTGGFNVAGSARSTYEGLGLPVRTLVLTAPAGTTTETIGTIHINGDNVPELMVIDASALPAGTVIILDNALAVVVTGPVVLTGGLGETTLFAGDGAQSATLGPDNDVLLGGAGNDTIGSLGGFDVLNGEAGDDIVSGGDDADRLLGTAGSDSLNGENGDDRIIITGGTHTVDGGDGSDTLVLNGSRAAATVTVAADGSVSISGVDASGNAYSASAKNVETIVFSDAVLNLETGADDPAGQVLRLYQGLFGREPDSAGAAVHIELLESGATTLGAIAEAFLLSGEFQSRFGMLDSLADEDFVTQLYQNVLGRTPDATGLAHSVSLLTSGMARGDLAVAFTQSAEFTETTSSLAAQGVLASRTPVVTGSSAGETFHGSYFDDTVDGGAGIDTFSIVALRSEVSISSNADGSVTLTDTLGLIGTDKLTGIERIQFLDGTLSFSPLDTPAQVNRLTQLVLDRDATQAELGTAVSSLDASTSGLTAIAAQLLSDPDFAGLSATLDNSALVNLFYTNGLGRAADAEGLAHWTAELDAGLAPADLLVILATSAEALGLSSAAPDNGLFFS